jgi:hypothetical protein
MASLEFEVQKAVDALLIAALSTFTPPGRSAPGVPVYDHAPQQAAYPYVRFGRKIKTPENLLAEKMARVQITLTVFSDFHGQEQVDAILARIEDTLDDAELTLAAGTAVRCDLERSDTVVDTDGKTYTGSAIYAVLVHP